MPTPGGLNINQYVERNEEQKSQRQVAGVLSHGQTAIKADTNEGQYLEIVAE